MSLSYGKLWVIRHQRDAMKFWSATEKGWRAWLEATFYDELAKSTINTLPPDGQWWETGAELCRFDVEIPYPKR